MRKFAFVFAALLGTSAMAATTTQLPTGVRPLHYDVSLRPDAAAAKFTGVVKIDLDVQRATPTIVLNAADMTIASARLTSGGAPMAARISVDNEAQTATFTFDRPVTPGRHTLELAYTGTIRTQATGLFRLDYQTPKGPKQALYTQFENSDARAMIPSWDEPSYKATFRLSVDVPKGQMAVSNTPVATRTDSGGVSHVTFAPTPKMSTYLLFFATGDFDRITARSGPTEIGVVAKAGTARQGQFALDSSVRILKEYNDYFGTPFPLPKLDNIGAPGSSQFFGAMENWGAIFTFDYAILLDPAISTQADKQSVFNVAAHEMAHQWFGDLVTMAWWDDLWLNEGFASWMQSRTTAKLHPEWNTALARVDVRDRAMSQDALATTHPVVQKVATVEQASQAFDAITYSKGESVIRMLEAYVGPDAWRDGVRRYIKAHAYGNTVSDDLWREMDRGGKPVTAIAHEFILQPGVPMIAASTTCSGGTSVVRLAQGEFTKDATTRAPLRWQVPVAVSAGGAPVTTLVNGGRGEARVPGCGPVVVNAGQAGYFRTLYDPAAFAALAKVFATLAPIDQAGILADSWALGLTGRQPVTDALDLASRVGADADPQIWGRVAGIVGTLDDFYRDDPVRQAAFRAFARPLLDPVLAHVGWTAAANEAPTVATLRNQLIGVLGTSGDQAVIAEARRRYMAGGDATPAAIRKTVLAVVAYNADAATWERMRGEAKAETNQLIKDEYYGGLLGIAADPALAQRALDLALTPEPGATNSASLIRAVAVLHPAMGFDFAVAHRAAVDLLVDTTSRSRYYPGLTHSANDPALADRLRAYAEANIAAGSRRPTEEAIANIAYRAKVRSDRLPEIDRWLAQRGR